MKFIISGAGIAGITQAYWLEKFGHECTLIEKAPDIRTEGYMIDFGGTGYDVADYMNIVGELQKRKHHIDRIAYRNAQGKTTSEMALSQLYRAANIEGKFFALNRRDLVEILYRHVEPNVQFGKSISAIEQSANSVHITFDDGSTDECDVLIGADGIHSNTRKIVFGDEENFSRYLGYHFAVFTIPALNHTLENAYNIYVEPNVQFGIYPMPEGEWMIFVIYRSEETTVPPPNERKAVLQRHLQHLGWIVPEVLNQMQDDTYIFYDTIKQIEMDSWSKNRVILIGDAAHCPTLISGQGASMAMAGAYMFGQALGNSGDYQQAVQSYENQLRPHIERIQKSARNFAPNFVPQNRMRIMMINWLLRLSKLPPVTHLIGKQFQIESILESA